MSIANENLMEKKTKSVTITQFDYIIRNFNDEEVDIHGHPNHYSEYDPEGRPLKEIRYNRLGEFEDMYVYGYDDQGNLVRESYSLAEDEIAEERTFVRNEAGMILHAKKHYLDGSFDTIAYEYNDAGLLVKRTTTTDEGEIEQVESFEWENGELVHHQVVDEEGELIPEPDDSVVKPSQTRVETNDKGQVIKEEEVDEHGEVFMTVNRSYNEDGLAEEVDVSIDGRGLAVSRHYFLKYEYTFFD
jgi:YD repeat-containing protein